MEKQPQGITPMPHSPEFLKKRKFYLAIPVLIIPFMTMAFWALGGGKNPEKNAALQTPKGLDLTLPMAAFNDQKDKDKMAIYQAAGKTSPDTGNDFTKAMGFARQKPLTGLDSDRNKSGLPVLNEADRQSAKIEAKLAEINRQISTPSASGRGDIYEPDDQETVGKIKQVKKMMRSAGRTVPDPEMQQLSRMLEQVQEIQNPGSVTGKIKKTEANPEPFKAISAIIDGKQKVSDGAEVKLKLTDSARLSGYFLPKGQILYGSCQITNQRLLLTIKNIRQGNNIIPVDLTVYSLDGLPGIPAHEAELSAAASGGADNALASMQFMTMDQSLGAQAAAGGIQAAKGLFSKKLKKIKVKLQNNFPVLLRDNARKK